MVLIRERIRSRSQDVPEATTFAFASSNSPIQQSKKRRTAVKLINIIFSDKPGPLDQLFTMIYILVMQVVAMEREIIY